MEPVHFLLSARRPDSSSTIQSAKIVDILADGRILLQLENSQDRVATRRRLASVSDGQLRQAAAEDHEVLLWWPPEATPVIVGVISEFPSENGIERIAAPRLSVEADDELVLRSGDASLTLRRNGRLVLRGTYIDSASKGVHRIKGGSVKIN